MGKRKWTTQEKLDIVLAGLKNKTGITELCRAHGISTPLYYQWRDAFLQGGKEGLEKGRRFEEKAKDKEIERLLRKIGELAVENDLLKKSENL